MNTLRTIAIEMVEAGLPSGFVLQVVELARKSESGEALVHLWFEAQGADKRGEIEADLRRMIKSQTSRGLLTRDQVAQALGNACRCRTCAAHAERLASWHQVHDVVESEEVTPPKQRRPCLVLATLDTQTRLLEAVENKCREKGTTTVDVLRVLDPWGTPSGQG